MTGSKKNLLKCSDPTGRINLVSKNEKLPVKRQCELLKVNRTSEYYKPIKPSNEDYEREEYIKARLDYWHTKMPYLGVRRLVRKLRGEDNITIGRKLVKRYMAEIGIYCIFPKPNLSKRNLQHKVFPYL
ncbi:transposase [Dehalobacterium formicoaceticum]|uniref:transposase n=1 Tax=Dehalobacterium formicoaceticum TaxID=51515 RepID=UPI003B84ACEB